MGVQVYMLSRIVPSSPGNSMDPLSAATVSRQMMTTPRIASKAAMSPATPQWQNADVKMKMKMKKKMKMKMKSKAKTKRQNLGLEQNAGGLQNLGGWGSEAETETSPWVSYPIASDSTTRCESWKSTTRYAPRFFLGGGKAGTTGLWKMLLTGTPWSGEGPTSSDFIGLAQEFKNRPHERLTGKEMCFSGGSLEHYNSLFEPSSELSNIGIDCCPFKTQKKRICSLWKLFPCEIKFAMLVRDPAERAVSWFNEKGQSHQRDESKVDEWTVNWVRKTRDFQLSTILQDALDCGVDPRAILVIDTDGLKGSPEEAQKTMDAIDKHYGIPRMRHEKDIANASNKRDERHLTAKAKPETITTIRKNMEEETRRFLSMLENPDGILQKALDF